MPSQCIPAPGAFEVLGLPAFNDNYIWLIRSPQMQGVIVVDPGDAAPVIDACRREGMLPDQIWLTHHHADHTGGVADISAWVTQQGGALTVIGPAPESIPGVTQAVEGGETWTIGSGLQVRVLSVPGHTRGHLAYLVEAPAAAEAPALFCGDVLFGMGCGRLFEGTAAQMAASLAQIRALPPHTRIYCAHEYTLMNLPFALAVDPANALLQERGAEIRRKRQAGEATVPLTLAVECATNPFLRCDQPALREAAMLPADATPVEVFTRLRQMRDTFKASF
jgi:hydroxyacylglutathione hydrolase